MSHCWDELMRLTQGEVEQLRALNKRLEETEAWILQRSKRALGDYLRAGGRVRYDFEDRLFEDIELDAEVTFFLSKSHRDYDGEAEDDNIVATLEAGHCVCDYRSGVVLPDPSEPPFNWNELQHRPPNPFSEDHFCYLFHQLYDHTDGVTWAKMLAIGTIWVDFKMTEQQGFKFR